MSGNTWDVIQPNYLFFIQIFNKLVGIQKKLYISQPSSEDFGPHYSVHIRVLDTTHVVKRRARGICAQNLVEIQTRRSPIFELEERFHQVANLAFTGNMSLPVIQCGHTVAVISCCQSSSLV